MKKIIMILVALIGFGMSVSAGNKVTSGRFVFTELSKGQYMIEDTESQQCLVTFSVQPTDTRGTVEIICNSKTARLVQSSSALVAIVLDAIPVLQLPGLILSAIDATYAVACAAYDYDH